MSFSSIEFIVLLGLVASLYWFLSHRGQNLLLLAASYVFYGWVHPAYLGLIFAISLTDFVISNQIANKPSRKRLWLTVTLAVDFGVLAAFKYLGFFVDNILDIMSAVGLTAHEGPLRIFLPIGISFYVFQSSAYVIDVYRGQLKPARSFSDYALFVSFFPQLVAGPIERAGRLLRQVQTARRFDASRVRSGILLMIWGFFKKLVIADNVAIICNQILSVESSYWPLLWAGIFAFGIQIYADFSAYSDIARGTARVLGIDLMLNFKHPYLSRSPSDFWNRWHISLSTWFRDYVYVPLGGNRCSTGRQYRNLMATFLLSGLWHGASWNFVLWGGFHGLLLVGERVLRRLGWLRDDRQRPWSNFVRWLTIFLLVQFGWLLFRETDPGYLRYYLTLTPWGVPAIYWQMAASYFLVALFYSIPLWLHPVIETRWIGGNWSARHLGAPLWRQLGSECAAGGGLFIAIQAFGSDTAADFIYFQF